MAERTYSAKPRSRSVLDNDLLGCPSSTLPPPLDSNSATAASGSSRLSFTRPVSPSGPTASTPPERDASASTPTLSSTAQALPLPSSRVNAATLFTPNSSRRITRASARQFANHPSAPKDILAQSIEATGSEVAFDHSQNSRPAGPSSNTLQSLSKKRKVEEPDDNRPDAKQPPSVPSSRRPKRHRTADTKSPTLPSGFSPPLSASTRSRKGGFMASMPTPGLGVGPSDGPGEAGSSSNLLQNNRSAQDVSTPGSPSSDAGRYSRQLPLDPEDEDTAMTGTDDAEDETMLSHHHAEADPDEDSTGNGDDDGDDDDDDDLHRFSSGGLGDPFGGGFARGSRLPAALSMLGGMLSMSGVGARLRDILSNLRRKEDPSAQLIALQELSEILLVSNEDNLIGSFSPDPYVRELVALMQPNEITGEENPEVMLLACRCLANLMEALPASAANVVYGGAVPVLCQKLLEISFIDLAEQALSTLEKISVEYPSSIIREGGLTACLSYLEFFATSTQRTAVTTAANCCRNIPQDSFPVVRDVMPILLNVLNSNDQRVVEQAALCVSRIVESFKYHPIKLEELVGVDLLKAILRLLLPGSANHSIGPNLHTQFLRVLSITANNSPRLAAELFKMNVVDTLYQILTGVSPPSGTDDIAAKLDSILIMQALIHRPREQIIETLNVICNLLPAEVDVTLAGSVPDASIYLTAASVAGSGTSKTLAASQKTSALNQKRLELLKDCKDEVRRFNLILFPTLIDAYSSTVNLDVRLRVLAAQIKMLSNFDRDIIFEALKAVPYASFLASILSQQDHPSLVISSLQATELLMRRFGDIYRYQLYREGVISEIEKISILPDQTKTELPMTGLQNPESVAARDGSENLDSLHVGHHFPIVSEPEDNDSASIIENNNELADSLEHASHDSDGLSSAAGPDLESESGEADDDAAGDALPERSSSSEGGVESDEHEDDDDDDDDADEDDEDEADHNLSAHDEEISKSPTSSENSIASDEPPPRRYVTGAVSRAQIAALAKRFLDRHETEKIDKAMRIKASQTLSSLTSLAEEISNFYLGQKITGVPVDAGIELFRKLAAFFDADVFENATSAELLGSGVVHVLERVLTNSNEDLANAARSAFLENFIGCFVKSQFETSTTDSPATPFSILVHKLQDLLSRSEHFEVVTVHHNTFDGNHTSAASMLAKQIRLRLVADDDSDVPHAFRSIMVSIHAIATFKTLEDYLRPRISLSDRSRSRHDGLSRAFSAMAEASSGTLGAAAAARAVAQGAELFSRGPPQLPETPSSNLGTSKRPGSQQPPITPQTPPPPAHHRSNRKSSKPKTTGQVAPGILKPPASSATGVEGKTGLRRSSRRNLSSANVDAAPRPPDNDNPLANALECADEKHLPDHNELDFSEDNTMDAVVGDLDEGMSDDGTPDPSAVNLEVAAGGSILARQEDGTRVFTPSQSSHKAVSRSRPSDATAALQSAPLTASTSDAPRSSASTVALSSAPQDWHIEFSLDGKQIPMDSTVYRAVLDSVAGRDEHAGRSVWSAVHTVHYRRVSGPKPPGPSGFGPADNAGNDAASPDSATAPAHLEKNPTTLSILRLLKNLHDLSANMDDILVTNKEAVKPNAEALLQFVNTKLTAKLNRQLEEPLIVASSCLPNWSEDLARLYPFLFPFETRHLFLQSTSFGYARSMARWQNAQVQEESRRDHRDERPFLGRLQRQKVRISRSRILESAVKVMELYGASQSILEVEYFEEVGTGLGPTLEFYSTVSREFSKKKLKLWRDNDAGDTEFVSGPNGLFPRPISHDNATGTNGERIMSLFRALGKFVARSMLDSRIIDINFNPIFFRIGDGSSGARPSLGAVKVVDPALARSLLLLKEFASAKKSIDEDPGRTAAEKVEAIATITINNTHIDDLSLDFTLPGYPEIELIPGGSHVSVTIDNVDMYLDKVVAMTLEGGVRHQVDAFRKGFSQVFPYSALSAFTPSELVSLFGRIEEDWSLETLLDSVKADHGFTMDSRSVKNLLQAMSEMTPNERRSFLQFTTGSPKLPIGGFRSLTPMFTVVCKPSEAPYTSDDYLPSVMTCVNYLKLPDYTSMEVLRKQLSTAVKEGQGAFHLS